MKNFTWYISKNYRTSLFRSFVLEQRESILIPSILVFFHGIITLLFQVLPLHSVPAYNECTNQASFKKTKKSMKQLLRKQFLQALARANSHQLAIHLLIHYLNCHWVFILVTFNHASIFQPLDILVNKSAKCFIAKKYQEWCVNQVLKQSNRCVQPHDPKVKTSAF